MYDLTIPEKLASVAPCELTNVTRYASPVGKGALVDVSLHQTSSSNEAAALPLSMAVAEDPPDAGS